jgi:hypothetical protein
MHQALQAKKSLFEKSDAKTFDIVHTIEIRGNGLLPPPALPPVMPAKAGIHDFSVSATKALDPGAKKSRGCRGAPSGAFAGMTGFFGRHSQTFTSLAGQLRAPFCFAPNVYRFLFKKRSASAQPKH